MLVEDEVFVVEDEVDVVLDVVVSGHFLSENVYGLVESAATLLVTVCVYR